MRFVQEQFRGYLPCECLIFSCVPGVATKYLSPFFCCIGPFYIESCIFNIWIFFSLLLVSLKKGLHGKTMEYLNKDNFFLPTDTPGSGVYTGLALGDLVFKLTIMIPRSVIQKESCIS